MSDIKLFGKYKAINTLLRLKASGRMPHGIILTGTRGIGKKILADWCACLMMCESDAAPCFSCRSCTKILSHNHPDVFYTKKEDLKCDKGEKITDKFREKVKAGILLPNDSDIRVYIFTDSDLYTPVCQNILLKAIEEPAPFNRYIFTCSDKEKILTTILSRLVEIPVDDMNAKDCIQCLVHNGVEQDKAEAAVSSYGSVPGNILSMLSDESKLITAQKAALITEMIANKDEYGALKEFSAFTEREALFEAVEMIYENICAAARGSENELALLLKRSIPLKKLSLIADRLTEAMDRDAYNPNVKIFVCGICSEIFDILL